MQARHVCMRAASSSLEGAAFVLPPRKGVATMKNTIPCLNYLRSVLAVLALTTQLDAQPFSLKGQVIDAETGAALEGANITGARAGTSTDQAGYFVLTITAGDTITVSFVGYQLATLRPTRPTLTVRLQPIALETQPLIVQGGLAAQALDEAAASVTLIDRRALEATGGHHLQDLTQAVPNLNWAGGTSRPRYFQIRGMGERSHYAGEGPPNFSVGFIMDDVDLSGMGMAAILFDLDQLEIFKGPQSTVFGPNAMAGLINLQSTEPSQVFSRRLTASAGNDALLHYAGIVNIPLSQQLAVRAGFHAARADGFRHNEFSNLDDSNRKRENFARLKVRYHGTDGLKLLGTFFRADLNNGYDAWTPNNNEDLVTYSDNPGRDAQLTTAFSLRGEMPLQRLAAELVSITSYSQTDLEHSFDSDWGNDQFWKQAPYNFDPEVEDYSYDFFERTLRNRDTFTQEVRLLKNDAKRGNGQVILGAYLKTQDEKDGANGYLFGGDATDLNSTFAVNNLAFYGQYHRDLAPKLRLAFNLRLDRNATTYNGLTNAGAENINFDVSQWLTGGKLALTYRLATRRTIYAAISRGYRSGGVNQHPFLAAHNRPFDPEYAINIETGLRTSGPRSTTALTLFHTLRSDQQVNLSSQQDPTNPNTFVFFIANASKGHNSGLELEQTYRLTSQLKLLGSLGYLDTRVDPYTFAAASGQQQTLGGRAAAHAPQYTARLGGEYRNQQGFFGRLELTAMDEFFFSDSHDQISQAYQLVNGSVGYGAGGWKVTLWGRNLADERYAVRGFFFSLEPQNDDKKLYVTHGEPRQVGLSVSTDF
jgi:iron complex outermembrane receptor protein